MIEARQAINNGASRAPHKTSLSLHFSRLRLNLFITVHFQPIPLEDKNWLRALRALEEVDNEQDWSREGDDK